MSDDALLILELYQIGALQFGDFTLKSGKQSKIYIDLRRVVSYPFILKSIAQAMWKKVNGVEFDLICGVPYTALPIATCISIEHHIPMVLRRKEKKEYGTKKLIEGQFSPGQRCLIIEDVITTGSSILETGDELANVGLVINDAVVLIDREETPLTALHERYQVHTILKLSHILQTLIESSLLNVGVKEMAVAHLMEMKK
jgi:orotate phosphoribosyltransferase